MVKQLSGSCVTQADQSVEEVHSLRKCVTECLRSNIDCQGVTYGDTGARCTLPREITLKLCDSGISPVTYTASKNLELSVDATTVGVVTTITTATTTTTQTDCSYPTPTPTGTMTTTAVIITTIAAQPTTSHIGQAPTAIIPYTATNQRYARLLDGGIYECFTLHFGSKRP